MKVMTGREYVTIEEVHAIRPDLEAYENKFGIVHKIWGMLSLVNAMWFFSILGLAISAIPTIK